MKRSRSSTGLLIAAAVFAVGVVLYAKRSSGSASGSTGASTTPATVLPPTLPPLVPDFGIENPTGGWS